ncbi:transcriptional regulator, BadM/Rrf2 family [Gracilibacillus ureilyticus]|uniref:HTH-type transcriptional regulator NsrR n=1 Tax=Gracilibacillus ureilyticus TaxID=531814 RepID=A0A1H9V0F7_9BACI|nr:Rrf2 family transcriptional regulator [Gracilibacillus ureilyticus]SES15152.1 transcriptional regulator, BadM/Rrf2 family [Gracilibacillus ureilyticus]
MRLKKYTDYALRVLIYTATKKEEKASIKEIADTFFISTEHVRKVVHQLSVNEYIETTRGRNGGITLAKQPGDINIGSVIRLMENDFYMLECFDGGHNQCVITSACKLRHVIGSAMQAFFQILDSYTLDDLIENKDELRELMGTE